MKHKVNTTKSMRLVMLHTTFLMFFWGFHVLASFLIAYIGCQMMQKLGENAKTRKPIFLHPR